MADYSQVNDYSAKDALATGNPLKLIKGSDIDADLSAIAAAILSKFDSTDIATAGEAQAGVNNTKVVTPARLTAWAQNNAGTIEDLQALADPGADRIMFWDASAGTLTFLIPGSGITITDTTISVDAGGLGGRTLTAGDGLSGGGDLSTDRTFTLDLNELGNETTIDPGDFVAMVDTTDGGSQKISFANLESALSIGNLSDFDANEIVDHTLITISAGTGLAYSVGGAHIGQNGTLVLDIDGLTEESTIDAVVDTVPFYDASAGVERKVPIDALVGAPLGDGLWYRNSAVNVTSSAATLVYNTAQHDSLSRGTFSTATGIYTAGSAPCRLLITASCRLETQQTQDVLSIDIQVDGSSRKIDAETNHSGAGVGEIAVVSATTILNLSAGQAVRCRIANTSTQAVTVGVANTQLSIVELA